MTRCEFLFVSQCVGVAVLVVAAAAVVAGIGALLSAIVREGAAPWF